MSWAVGYDDHWKRDIGYGVPAFCDHPGCSKEIDRGLSYVCGGEPCGGDNGCGLYFCGDHLGFGTRATQCLRCRSYKSPYKAKADHPTWMRHKLTDESWAQWRNENPAETAELARAVNAGATPMDEAQSESAQGRSSSSSPHQEDTKK